MNTQTRLLSVDLLRGMAAILVFLFHAALFAGFDKFRLPVSLPFVEKAFVLPNIFSLGASGVSLFFVVSGYCLTRKWYMSGVDSFSLSEYYFRRFARIYPAYMFSLVVTLISLGISQTSLLSNTQRGIDWTDLAVDFFVHALFLQGFFPLSFQSFNGTLWSMSTEVQFYLVLPFIYLCSLRTTRTVGVSLALVFCLVVRYVASSDATLVAPVTGGVSYSVLVSYSLLGRIFEFVIGMYIASLESKSKLPEVNLFSLLLVFGGAMLIRWTGVAWLADPFFGVAYGALLIFFIRVFDLKPNEAVASGRSAFICLQSFGVYSYSFFLIHWPIMFLSQKLNWTTTFSNWGRLLIEAPACFVITYIASKYMYMHVEERGQSLVLNWRKSSALP